jgi:hypothetical protein
MNVNDTGSQDSDSTRGVRNVPSVGLTVADVAAALVTLRERDAFTCPVPEFTVQARRIVVRTEHGDVWITPGLVRAADNSWRQTLTNSVLDRASRAAKAIAANYPATPEPEPEPESEPVCDCLTDSDEQVDWDRVFASWLLEDSSTRWTGLFLGDIESGEAVHLIPCCDEPDLTLDVTPALFRDGAVDVLPERPLCSDGIIRVATWLSGVLAGLVDALDEPLVVCNTLMFALRGSGDGGFEVTVVADRTPEEVDLSPEGVTVLATRQQMEASATWWQQRAAHHLSHLL